MDFTNIKDMSIDNLKIKEIWYNGNILYQEQSKRELTLIQMGEVTFNNIYIAPQVSNIDGGIFTLIKMGEVTVNSYYIPPQISIIDGGSVKLLEMGQTTITSS